MAGRLFDGPRGRDLLFFFALEGGGNLAVVVVDDHRVDATVIDLLQILRVRDVF
ncbi:MAG: hypothetical protein GXP35_11360 [Actinobacteria bacterium]|nr:hypothetical protein [Actinomycetota bacterium]